MINEPSDATLLERFATFREEAAFAALVQRHGPRVLGVCRRIVRNEHDAEEVSQATFLVLARKAGELPWRDSIGPWLCAVAQRLALNARAGASRRLRRELPAAVLVGAGIGGGSDSGVGTLPDECHPQADPLADIARRELRRVLDEELSCLPEKYRAPVVLCYLEGMTNEQAARELGWPSGSMSRRLERARTMLRQRLASRGVLIVLFVAFSLFASFKAWRTPSGTANDPARVSTVMAPFRPARDGGRDLERLLAELAWTDENATPKVGSTLPASGLDDALAVARESLRVAAQIEGFDPGRDRPRWRDYAAGMRRSAQALSDAAERGEVTEVVAAARQLNQRCIQCHLVFGRLDELPAAPAAPAASVRPTPVAPSAPSGEVVRALARVRRLLEAGTASAGAAERGRPEVPRCEVVAVALDCAVTRPAPLPPNSLKPQCDDRAAHRPGSNHERASTMTEVNRRTFISAAAGTVATASLAGRASADGPNETIRAAILGVNGRGTAHMAGFTGTKGVKVAVLCDPDRKVLDERLNQFEKKHGYRPEGETDLRKVYDRKDVDVVSVATPNHWHSLAAIWACQAGKDVYVEKPGSHNVFEGRKMVEAAKKYGRIVQHGVQLRSSPAIREAVEHLRKGVIGKVYMARGLVFRDRASIGHAPDPDVAPATLNWDIWQGPAQERAYSKRLVHYNWHWHWNYGNGDVGNQGVHETDMCLWGLGLETLPSSITAMGGKFLWDDDKETPEVLSSSYHFPEQNQMIEFEVRPWASNLEGGAGVGNIFYGSEGYMVIKGYNSYETFLGRKGDQPGPKGSGGDPLGKHFANFIEAVRKRDTSIQNGPVETAHYSSALAHLGNIAYRVGRRLNFDPKAEKFIGDSEADALLTRNYRKPYVVPEQV